jgi:ubiquitin-conjugating enzyme E2 Q
MSLSVPPVSSLITRAYMPNAYHQPIVNSPPVIETQVGIDVKLDLNRQEVIFEEGQTCPVFAGHWIVVNAAGTLSPLM